MVFCNPRNTNQSRPPYHSHNPYFNRWFSAIKEEFIVKLIQIQVTILILIDGFLQLEQGQIKLRCYMSHNPYFNRWFSAMCWRRMFMRLCVCHNPYFNRWFSAIGERYIICRPYRRSQSLF